LFCFQKAKSQREKIAWLKFSTQNWNSELQIWMMVAQLKLNKF
jgi:hypothetical protein